MRLAARPRILKLKPMLDNGWPVEDTVFADLRLNCYYFDTRCIYAFIILCEIILMWNVIERPDFVKWQIMLNAVEWC